MINFDKICSYGKYLDSYLVFLTACLIVIFSTPQIGLSPDSITYLSTARNLSLNGRFLCFSGGWLTDFPAGYPIFLSLIMYFIHIDLLSSGLIVNGLLFGTLNVICLQQIKKNNLPVLLKWLYGSLILFSPCYLQIYSMLWSETLFILLIAIFFVICERYANSHKIGLLVEMAIVTGIICITRYIGMTILMTGVTLLLIEKDVLFRKKIIRIFIFSVISVSFLVINLLLNKIYGENLLGEKARSEFTLLEHLTRYGKALHGWFPLFMDSPLLYVCYGIGFIICPIAGIIYLLTAKKNLFTWFNIGLLFITIYSLFLIAMSMVKSFDPINNRLLSPLYLPAVGALIKVIDLLDSRYRKRDAVGHIIKAGSFGFIIMAVVFGIQRQYNYFIDPDSVYIDKAKYNFNDFENSPTIAFLAKHNSIFSPEKNIYSNGGDLLYMFGINNISGLPALDSKEEMQDFILDADYLIWLNKKYLPGDYLFKLKAKAKLKPVYTFADGAIFIISR